MQQLAMSERSRKLTEQWLRKVADLDGRSRFVGNGLLVDAPDMEAAMQSTETKLLANGRRLVDDEVDRPRTFSAGNHSNEPRGGDAIFSSSRSWRSCSEEVIKKVIRESLLLRNSSDGDKGASSRSLGSYLRGGFNLPDHEGEMKTKNTVAALDRPVVKMKAPSLIARLMGLEGVPAGADRPPAKTKPSSDQDPNAASLMLHLQKPERVTLGSIFQREKIERLMSRGSEQDCGDRLVKEHPPSVAQELQKTSWWREERQYFSSCKCKLEYGEIITGSDRQKTEPELERKEVRILRKTKLEPPKNSKTPTSAKALKQIDGSRGRPGFSRDQLLSRNDVKASAAPLSSSKKNAAASVEPQRRAGTAKRNLSDKIERKLAFRNSTTPPVETKGTAVKPTQKMITKSKIAKQKHGEEVSPSCKPKDAPPVINTSSPAAGSRLQKQLSSKSSINERTKKDQKMICEIMPKANHAAAAAAAVKLADNDLIDTKRTGTVEYLESLLLGCQSFLMALGDADACTHHEARDRNQIDKDLKLYLSCAEELILRKRYHEQQLSSHPLLLKRRPWRSAEHAVPLDELLGEISKGIRRLAGYGEVDHEVSSEDSLYVRLERDLECKDLALDAVWDVEWRNAICVEEADRVAGQLEEHVLSALLEEFAMELANCCCCCNQKG